MKNRVSASALIICLFLLSTVLYYNTIGLFPVFMHAWTQSEHYALALCFLENGFDFFHPCTFNLQTIDGITPTDFPINEYIVALIMKATGSASPVIYRTYTLFISIAGLLFLYSLAKKITGSEIKSWLVTLFAFLSPVYIYYQSGFLPSVPAIAFTFIAYFHYFSFKNDNRKKQLYLAVLFFLLAALVRRPFFIFLFAALLQEMWSMFKSRKTEWSAITAFTLSIIVFFSYYRYNVYLSKIYGNAFLDSFLPARSWDEFQAIVHEIYRTWKLQYFTGAHYIMLIIVFAYFIYNALKRRTIAEDHKKYWLQLFLIFSGTLCYFGLMMRQYYDHDYYFLDSLFVPIVLLIAVATNEMNITTGKQRTIGLFFVLMIILAFVSGKQVQEARYTVNEWDRVEQSRVNYTGFDKYLDSAGIPKDSKILVIESYSTNIPLILMKRKGYTVYQTNRDNPVFPLFRFDWDYVAIQDIFLVSDVIYYYPVLKSLLERVGGNGKISLYKQSASFKPKSLKAFLGVDSTNSLYSNCIDFDSEITDEHLKHFGNKTNEVSYSRQNAAILKPEIEYQSVFSIKGNELKKNQNLKILITAHMRSNEPIKQLQLIASVATQTETKFYQSFDLNRQIKHENKWEKMETQFVLPSLAAEDELKLYFWNRASEKVYCDDFDIVIYN